MIWLFLLWWRGEGGEPTPDPLPFLVRDGADLGVVPTIVRNGDSGAPPTILRRLD